MGGHSGHGATGQGGSTADNGRSFFVEELFLFTLCHHNCGSSSPLPVGLPTNDRVLEGEDPRPSHPRTPSAPPVKLLSQQTVPYSSTSGILQFKAFGDPLKPKLGCPELDFSRRRKEYISSEENEFICGNANKLISKNC